jgi:CRP/FNR family transcriptional regulator, cyclic AMP receptor protein
LEILAGPGEQELSMAARKQSVRTPLDFFTWIDAPPSTQDYQNKQAIFVQGDQADALFYIRVGHVKLTVTSKDGKKAVIAILRRGDFFGEGCVTSRSLRISTATAIQATSIARVMRTDIVRMIREEPAFAKLFISHLLVRIDRIEEEFLDQIFNSSEKRLARVLLLMAGLGPHAETEPTLIKVSQRTLAEMVGTTRSRVSYFMNSFRSRGFIDYNGSVRVLPGLLAFLTEN